MLFMVTQLPFFITAASMNGNVMVAKILIENGADVNKVDKIKKSALMVRHNCNHPLCTLFRA